ncbi:MAG TPA: ribonuclease R family protein [Thermoanaerobaculia bacterium]|nr:ribonuclease R family protein [Thermoanaerobaculia bacterium]
MVTGTLRVTPSGFGLVEAGEEKVFVGAGELGSALDDDRVEVGITGRSESGPRGRIVRVLARTPRRLCGVLDEKGGFVVDDARYGRHLRCAAGRSGPTAAPPLLGVELLADLDPGAAEVRVERRFGRRGDPRAEEEALLWREGLAGEYPAAAVAEAELSTRAVQAEVDSSRIDRRDVPFVTIDPASAEDHDDALFAERLPDGGTRALVAIADVGAFVPSGGALDLEARRRGASLYLPGRVVPMLPLALSARAASLVPGADRVAMLLEVELDEEARLRSHWLGLATIRSRAKLTYEDAGAVLAGHEGSAGARAHAGTLFALDRLAQRLRESRRQRGAIAVEAPAVVVETDPASGLPVRIHRTANPPEVVRAQQLVEELMLLANETVAGRLRDEQARVLFRVHDAPTDARAMRLVEAARRQGVELDATVALDPLKLRELLRTTSDRALRESLSALLLDALPGALYASHRHDHFALASDHYVHFTSPIRRYADLTIHRAIRALVANGAGTPVAVDPLEVNRTQQRARAIQREVGDLYAALLMRNRVGQSFEGTIVRVLKRQWVVALDEPAVVVRCLDPGADGEEGARVAVRVVEVSIGRRAVLASPAARAETSA